LEGFSFVGLSHFPIDPGDFLVVFSFFFFGGGGVSSCFCVAQSGGGGAIPKGKKKFHL